MIEYLKMTPDEFEEFTTSLQIREKKLDAYHDQILEWLKAYPDLSGAQVFDWLEEKLDFKEVAKNRVSGTDKRQ